MAVKVFCSDVIGAFTHCNPVAAIYTYGEQVWPMGPVPFGTWYVSWSPSDLSGTFKMFGSTYNLQDYSGFYSWSGSTSGCITDEAFDYTGMTYMETNVKSIYASAFRHCSSLENASMVRVRFIDFMAFQRCSSLSRVYAPNVRLISYYAFQYCYSLKSIDFPKCERVMGNCFERCSMLETVNLPKCSVVENTVFSSCSNLVSVNIPLCEEVWGAAFLNCYSLPQIEIPMCKSIGTSAFMNCSSLQSMYLPLCSSVGTSAFMNCITLSQIDLPVCSLIGVSAFQNCTSLNSITLPVCENIFSDTFKNCASLSYVDLGTCSRIYSGAFNNTALRELYLRSSSIVDIVNGDAFLNTPMAQCAGSIYVPFGLYGLYKRDLGWQSLWCNLRSMVPEPGSYYINWTPASFGSNDSFTMDGGTFFYNDLSGSFIWFDGVITEGAFEDTHALTMDTNAYSIASSAFFQGHHITTFSASSCEYVGGNAFDLCSELVSVSLPVCEYIDSYAFRGCYSLNDIELPMCSYLGNGAFWNCSSLSSISLPVCEYVGSSAFYKCKFSLMYLPSCSFIGSYAFNSCSLMEYVELPVCDRIESGAFDFCSQLSILKIGNSSVCMLVSRFTFYSAGITSSTGSILVPASLVDSYKADSVWSYYRNRIFPIS